jgi:hypothetical protein
MYFQTKLNSTYAAACERFLVRPVIDGDVYITDIDMMILAEVPSLQEFHIKEMLNDGLFY